METRPQNDYEQIKVTGTPSVRLVERKEYNNHELEPETVILILGPTGAGKSTFIEALASNTWLGISSNQLEGFTQSISAYQLINVRWTNGDFAEDPIYLIDVPGFSDTKISEMKILSMLKDWTKKTGLSWFNRILYFMPINTPRLPLSQQEVLRTFQALTGIHTAKGITVVTTMWDCLGSETAKQRAESNFNQLREGEYIDKKAQILKFHNTQESALSIIDHSYGRYSYRHFELHSLLSYGFSLQQTGFGASVYEGLQTRLRNVHMELANIQSDLLKAGEQGDEQLTGVLVPRQEEAQKLLAMFEQELREFGDPPNPAPVTEERQLPNQPIAFTSLHDTETQDTAPAPASPHTDDDPLSVIVSPPIAQCAGLPLRVIATSPQNIPTASQTQTSAAPPSCLRESACRHSPATITQLDPSCMLMLKELLRRMISAAKRQGKTWFRKTKD